LSCCYRQQRRYCANNQHFRAKSHPPEEPITSAIEGRTLAGFYFEAIFGTILVLNFDSEESDNLWLYR
jgi:hypothetical protein